MTRRLGSTSAAAASRDQAASPDRRLQAVDTLTVGRALPPKSRIAFEPDSLSEAQLEFHSLLDELDGTDETMKLCEKFPVQAFEIASGVLSRNANTLSTMAIESASAIARMEALTERIDRQQVENQKTLDALVAGTAR